jgi:hypothetical protein
MAIREVRSPWSRECGPAEPGRIGVSPVSSPRNDGFGHVAPHVGKGGTGPASLARDLEQSSAGTGNKVIPPVKP